MPRWHVLTRAFRPGVQPAGELLATIDGRVASGENQWSVISIVDAVSEADAGRQATELVNAQQAEHGLADWPRRVQITPVDQRPVT